MMSASTTDHPKTHRQKEKPCKWTGLGRMSRVEERGSTLTKQNGPRAGLTNWQRPWHTSCRCSRRVLQTCSGTHYSLWRIETNIRLPSGSAIYVLTTALVFSVCFFVASLSQTRGQSNLKRADWVVIDYQLCYKKGEMQPLSGT